MCRSLCILILIILLSLVASAALADIAPLRITTTHADLKVRSKVPPNKIHHRHIRKQQKKLAKSISHELEPKTSKLDTPQSSEPIQKAPSRSQNSTVPQLNSKRANQIITRVKESYRTHYTTIQNFTKRVWHTLQRQVTTPQM